MAIGPAINGRFLTNTAMLTAGNRVRSWGTISQWLLQSLGAECGTGSQSFRVMISYRLSRWRCGGER